MATINQLRVERLAFFRELKRALRNVDTAQEAMERKINSVLSRKRDVPEVSDLEEVEQRLVQVIDAMGQVNQVIRAADPIFSVV